MQFDIDAYKSSRLKLEEQDAREALARSVEELHAKFDTLLAALASQKKIAPQE